jgi:hypothetical protein
MSFMLSVANKSFMLNVIMLNIVHAERQYAESHGAIAKSSVGGVSEKIDIWCTVLSTNTIFYVFHNSNIFQMFFVRQVGYSNCKMTSFRGWVTGQK